MGDSGHDDDLTKLHVELPNHWATGGEALWAKPLGGDEYEVRNVPFYIYGLNFLDVVRAVAKSEDRKPSILEVTRPSGHRTLRVIFDESCPDDQRRCFLAELNELGTTYEGVDDMYFALDIPPESDLSAVEGQLAAWAEEGHLDYETCEARAPGSFDAGEDDPDID